MTGTSRHKLSPGFNYTRSEPTPFSVSLFTLIFEKCSRTRKTSASRRTTPECARIQVLECEARRSVSCRLRKTASELLIPQRQKIRPALDHYWQLDPQGWGRNPNAVTGRKRLVALVSLPMVEG